MKGFDATDGRQIVRALDKIEMAGIGFIGRYYSASHWKVLTPIEAVAISGRGISIVSAYEDKGGADHSIPESFNSARAKRDADRALQQANDCGQPPSTTIYFCVDCDPDAVELATYVIPYFKALDVSPYNVGVYGSGLVCTVLQSRRLVHHTWLGGAMEWAGSRSYASWNIRQGLPSDPYHFGFQIDPDEARGDDFGQWKVAIKEAA